MSVPVRRHRSREERRTEISPISSITAVGEAPFCSPLGRIPSSDGALPDFTTDLASGPVSIDIHDQFELAGTDRSLSQSG